MKKAFLLIATLLLASTLLHAQPTQNSSLSIIISGDYDKYSFNTVFSEHSVHLSGDGLSKAVGALYERQYLKHWLIDIGLGYYQYNFDISRNINYFDQANPIAILYSTKNYYYNCISLSLQFNYIKYLKNNFAIRGGIGYTHYHTFSQKYQIIGGNGGSLKERSSFPFANAVFISGGMDKRIGDYGFGVLFNFPLWKNWHKDNDVLFESNVAGGTNYHNEKGHGLGIGIKGTYYF